MANHKKIEDQICSAIKSVVGSKKNVTLHEPLLGKKESIYVNKCLKISEKNISFNNPYGDGKSAQRIVNLLKTLDTSDAIIQKRITY